MGLYGIAWVLMGVNGCCVGACGRSVAPLRRAVAKKAWRAARLALLGRLAGPPNASASRDAVPCLRAPRGFAMVGVSAEVTCLTHPAGGTPRAWVGGPASRSPGVGPGHVRRQERLMMTAQEARTRHAGVRFLCDGFFIGFIGFARSSATMLAGTHLPTNRLWSVGGFPCPPRWPM